MSFAFLQKFHNMKAPISYKKAKIKLVLIFKKNYTLSLIFDTVKQKISLLLLRKQTIVAIMCRDDELSSTIS
jgi:hypothetical protein